MNLPDYIGFGPLFATPTKPDYTPIGTEQITAAHEALTLPVSASEGSSFPISTQSWLPEHGAVVIVSDLLLATDPVAQTARCRALLQKSGDIG